MRSSVDWTVTSVVSLEDACVLAVRAVQHNDGGSAAGILASTSTGVVSDASWKCSTVYQTGWHRASFDDSAWSYAHVKGTNGGAPWGTITGIDAQAKWIWTYQVIAGDTIYCRKPLC